MIDIDNRKDDSGGRGSTVGWVLERGGVAVAIWFYCCLYCLIFIRILDDFALNYLGGG